MGKNRVKAKNQQIDFIGLSKKYFCQKWLKTQIGEGIVNRLKIVGETLHHALNVLVQVDPAWVRGQVTAEWFFRYGQHFSDYRLPKGKLDRQQLAETIGQDSLHILTQIYSDAATIENVPVTLRPISPSGLIRQQYLSLYHPRGRATLRHLRQRNYHEDMFDDDTDCTQVHGTARRGARASGLCRHTPVADAGAAAATARLWHTSSKSPGPPVGRYVQRVLV
jgi:hypothetical protein